MDNRKAIFLSYASDDAAAAQRICETLRGAGVEVWFDRTELRGGDAWDASIRQQIRDCFLFLPIISSHTEERREGYFRREWNLAAERTLDMAPGVSFIVPVAIDETHQRDSKVPDKFRSVQWTRLPEGNATEEFVAHIQRLLGIGVARAQSAGVQGTSATARANLRIPIVAYVLGGLVVLGIAGSAWYLLRVRTENSAPVDKSIAVLPFVDMSEKKDQEYFPTDLPKNSSICWLKIRNCACRRAPPRFISRGRRRMSPRWR